MTYKYKIRKKAMNFIDNQEPKQKSRIFKAIYSLPENGDIKKMTGKTNIFRLRVGSIRIIFEADKISNTVTLIDVIDAGNRGQIYKKH